MITVKRAYEELEREGIIYRRQGLGTFVASTAVDRSREAKTQRARELLREAVREATEAGLASRRDRPPAAVRFIRGKRAEACPQTRLKSVGWRSAFPTFQLGPLDLTVPAGAIYGLRRTERRGQDDDASI